MIKKIARADQRIAVKEMRLARRFPDLRLGRA